MWEKPLEKVFPTRSHHDTSVVDTPVYDKGSIYVCKNKVAKPTVFIPVFREQTVNTIQPKPLKRPAQMWLQKVFKNLTPEDIRDSVKIFERHH